MGLPSPVYWAWKRKAESPGEPEFYCAKVPQTSVTTAGTEADFSGTPGNATEENVLSQTG